MYWVFKIVNDKVTCHGSFSHEFAAYAKKKRLQGDGYVEVEIIQT
tara:strand:+ start:411 stop:545 length:135 start_codon:yes stop_codon:yes gene_type:complete